MNSSKQVSINYNELEVTGISCGAKQFLYKTVRDHIAQITSYDVHQRINLKANYLMGMGDGELIYKRRYILTWEDRKMMSDLKKYYEHLRYNRFDALKYVAYKDHGLFDRGVRLYDILYSIIMKTTASGKKERYRIIDEYINTGAYNIQSTIK